MMRGAIGAALAAILPLGALAEGFTVIDLGVTRDRETCLYRAEQALSRYEREYGLSEFEVTTWIVFAYDLRPGDQDLTISCPILGEGEGFVNAFLHVHGEASPQEREDTATAIENFWFE